MTPEEAKKTNEALISVANTCCSCDELLPFGGHWGLHKEGYRVGPFCNDCTEKPSIEHEVDDPSIYLRPTSDKAEGSE